MKKLLFAILFAATFTFIGCGDNSSNKEEKGTQVNTSQSEKQSTGNEDANSETPPSERIDLSTKGVGPVEDVELSDEIDQALAKQGEKNFKQLCMACHQVDRRFVGPSPQGIMNRRSPEWVMNMILAPEKMVEEDPLAKELFMEFNQSPMTNQNLTREEARAILEYFRTLS